MKALLICVLLTASLFVEINSKHSYIPVKPPAGYFYKDSIPSNTNVIDFTTQVKPILVSRCSPCHFTGGKMYARLPFDKDTTIIAHGDVVLRRIKEEKEKALIQQYIQQQGNK